MEKSIRSRLERVEPPPTFKKGSPVLPPAFIKKSQGPHRMPQNKKRIPPSYSPFAVQEESFFLAESFVTSWYVALGLKKTAETSLLAREERAGLASKKRSPLPHPRQEENESFFQVNEKELLVPLTRQEETSRQGKEMLTSFYCFKRWKRASAQEERWSAPNLQAKTPGPPSPPLNLQKRKRTPPPQVLKQESFLQVTLGRGRELL